MRTLPATPPPPATVRAPLTSRLTDRTSEHELNLRTQTSAHLRTLWRRGRDRATVRELTRLLIATSPRRVTDDDTTHALGWCVEHGQCVLRAPSVVHLTPAAKAVFTLTDQTLDRPLPRFGDGDIDHAVIRQAAADALTLELPRALRLNAPRTVEYLLRARHGLSIDRARALAADIAAAGLHRPAGLLLADLAPLTDPDNNDAAAAAARNERADRVVRNILGLPEPATEPDPGELTPADP